MKKRKRGHKKGGKAKGTSASASAAVGGKEALLSVNMESNTEEIDNVNDSGRVEAEADTPSSTGTDQPCNVANINPDGSINKAVGKPVGRVKVKLRTPKTIESQLTSSDAPTHSGTDKSSPHMEMGLERQSVVTEKMEDSANSLPEVKISASGSSSKKAGSIKIKSSKVSGSSLNQTSDALATRGIRHDLYDKQELDASLTVF